MTVVVSYSLRIVHFASNETLMAIKPYVDVSRAYKVHENIAYLTVKLISQTSMPLCNLQSIPVLILL